MPDRDRTVVARWSSPVGARSYGRSMASRQSPVDRLASLGLDRPEPGAEDGHVVDSHLHGDDDSICPRCLQWIDGRDYVRRTGYGLLQHEVCP